MRAELPITASELSGIEIADVSYDVESGLAVGQVEIDGALDPCKGRETAAFPP